MKTAEAIQYVKDNQEQTKRRFKVTYNDGTWELLRLSVGGDGGIIEFPKNVSRYWKAVTDEAIQSWYNIERVYNKADAKTTLRRNLIKLSEKLNASGLWPGFKGHALRLLDLPLPQFEEIANAASKDDARRAIDEYCPAGADGMAPEMVMALANPTVIKPMAFPNGERASIVNRIDGLITSGIASSVSWYNKRNNTVTTGHFGGQPAGTYAEERQDKSDTRYYVVLDSVYALALGAPIVLD